MKKKDILGLIRYHVEKNEPGFRNQAYEIAKDFDASGDSELAEYVMAMLSSSNAFIPMVNEYDTSFFEKINDKEDMLLLPPRIYEDILGVVNAVSHNMGINRFLFQGAPGTGKTEAVKQLARILNRDIYMVDFASIVDSKLGQTQKNIKDLFQEMNSFTFPEKVIVLFDEIDALALDRTNQNDLREMGRTTSSMLKYMERINENLLLVATTNLYEHFDKALIRRFDTVIDFNRYERDDLIEIADHLLDRYLQKFKLANKDIRLFNKILELYDTIPYPGDLKNIIRTAVAFSDPKDGSDYFRRLYRTVKGQLPEDPQELKKQNFTLREMELLTKKSKSTLSRELSEA